MSVRDIDDHEHPGPKSECFICRNEREFVMPAEVVDACADGRLVIFAGAGISTESRTVLSHTLYDEVGLELGLIVEEESFPERMSRFVSVRSRRALLQRIIERLDYVNAFPELRGLATRFHRELSTLFYVRDIITTNWDAYFEQECGALPLVTDRDFALSDMPGRRVFKIHGSIFNIGSIVATAADYNRCYRALDRTILGGTLKNLLATKTVLFVGYSFRDSDFARIYRFIKRQMADVLPNAYVVTLDEAVPRDFKGAQVITTDATFFVRRLKEELLPRGCLLDDRQWHDIASMLVEIQDRHFELYSKVNLSRVPAAVLCGSYQDGLIHAFERMLERRATGEYSHVHRVEGLVAEYEGMRKDFVRQKRYQDAAYVEGYQNGLIYLVSDSDARTSIPKYLVYGSPKDLQSLSAFRTEAVRAKALHRQAYRQAERIAGRWGPGMIPHHRPQL